MDNIIEEGFFLVNERSEKKIDIENHVIVGVCDTISSMRKENQSWHTPELLCSKEINKIAVSAKIVGNDIQTSNYNAVVFKYYNEQNKDIEPITIYYHAIIFDTDSMTSFMVGEDPTGYYKTIIQSSLYNTVSKFNGIKKEEREDLEKKLMLIKIPKEPSSVARKISTLTDLVEDRLYFISANSYEELEELAQKYNVINKVSKYDFYRSKLFSIKGDLIVKENEGGNWDGIISAKEMIDLADQADHETAFGIGSCRE